MQRVWTTKACSKASPCVCIPAWMRSASPQRSPPVWLGAEPANVIAARYHDHVFVPQDKATEALEHLQALADPDSDSTLTQRGYSK